MTEVSELHQVTLVVLKKMYEQFGKDAYHRQLRADLASGIIINKVAFHLYNEGRWVPPEPAHRNEEHFFGAQFPIKDRTLILDILWQFVGIGILVPRSIDGEDNQHFQITPYGEKVLEEEEKSPYDPYGFLKSIGPFLEPESNEFIEEAVKCFMGCFLRASLVMIGLASENEILNLIELYTSTLSISEKEKFTKKIKPRDFINTKFEVLFNWLSNNKKELPVDIREIDVWLRGIFHNIRISRNEAGHPISIVAHTNEDVFEILVLFRRYARNLSQLKDYLSKKATP